MATYKVTFSHSFKVQANSEEEALDLAVERASEYRLDEVNEIGAEELD